MKCTRVVMLNISTLLSIRFVHQNSGADQTSIMQCCYHYRKLAPASDSRIQLHCGLNSNIIFSLPHKRHIRFFFICKDFSFSPISVAALYVELKHLQQSCLLPSLRPRKSLKEFLFV